MLIFKNQEGLLGLRRQIYFSLSILARKLTYRSEQNRLNLIKKLFDGDMGCTSRYIW
jgi:hypothetical protein